MFARRINSALFIDFDNVMGREFASSVANWMAWLEDGHFDEEKRKRRFVEKRVYWNAHNDSHRSAFESNGFVALTCRSHVRHKKKSTADMNIALDAIESAHAHERIQEYIVLTTDTDFVPLIERLGEHKKNTVVMMEKDTASERVYPEHADIVIRADTLRSARTYARPDPLFSRAYKRVAAVAARVLYPFVWSGRTAAGGFRWVRDKFRGYGRQRAATADLASAAKLVADLGRTIPGSPLGRKTVTRLLSKNMPGRFQTVGRSAYLGCNTYAEMIARFAGMRSDLQLATYSEGGTAIVAIEENGD
jgi:uncharacterized LabA/DUF88 family protein